MSRETLIRHLAQAEARIALGRKHIARQYEIIAELEQVGHDAVTAKALLVRPIPHPPSSRRNLH